jgi:hypothetical protein
MKHGDRVLCKKSFVCGSFIVGEYYEVQSNCVAARLGDSKRIPAVVIRDGHYEEWYFSRDDKENYSYVHNFFTSIKIERKLKLKRICQRENL